MQNWQLPVKCIANAVHWQMSYTAGDYELAKAASKTAQLCSKCGTIEAPEWRRGPLGPRTLCNRCGLRYSREQAQQVQCLRKMAINSILNEETR